MLIAKYTASVSGVLPTFNDGYQYTVNETNSNGIYTVELYSNEDFSYCSFSDKSNLLTVEYLKVTSNVTNMRYMFYYCQSLTSLDVSNWDTSNVTNMGYMFRSCSQLTRLDLSNWDTSNVNDMDSMLVSCESLTSVGDLSNWDTSNVTNMYEMFWYSYNLKELNLSNWNTSKVTNMTWLFADCINLRTVNLSGWDLTNNDISDMFSLYYWNEPLEINTIIMNNSDYNSVNKIIAELPTRTSDSMGTLSVFGVDDITQVDITTAQSKYWNVHEMLIAKYTTNASGVLPVFNRGYQYAVNETESNGVYIVELSSNEDFSYCGFERNSNLLTVEYLKVTSNVTDMSYMFKNSSSLTQLDVSNWDTSNVTTMYGMFNNCTKLTHLDVSNFDTRNVTDMCYMLYNCSSLTHLDVSNFNMKNVISMDYMFDNTLNLQHVGMLYCDNNTVNTIANVLPTVSGLTRTIYIQDTKSDIYTPRDSIVFYDYKDFKTIITLPQQLNSGDMLTWDDLLSRYILKKADGTVIEMDTDMKYVLDVVGSYCTIETDEKESEPASMSVKLYIFNSTKWRQLYNYTER